MEWNGTERNGMEWKKTKEGNLPAVSVEIHHHAWAKHQKGGESEQNERNMWIQQKVRVPENGRYAACGWYRTILLTKNW